MIEMDCRYVLVDRNWAPTIRVFIVPREDGEEIKLYHKRMNAALRATYPELKETITMVLFELPRRYI